MELYFNELSIKDTNSIDYHTAVQIAGVYKELKDYQVTTCRIGSKENTRLFGMIQNIPDSVNVKNFYFAFFRSPYESDAVEQKQDEYYAHSWSCDGETCEGFAFADLMDSAGFSIYSQKWNQPWIDLQKDERAVMARNICTAEHVKIHLPQMKKNVKTELVKTSVPVVDKAIDLRDDHGMAELERFSKRLIHSPYVVGVVNSLPFNPHNRRFIRQVRENGLVEIVLPWTDEGLGIVIKTTGRSLRETEEIAKLLEKEYGYI